MEQALEQWGVVDAQIDELELQIAERADRDPNARILATIYGSVLVWLLRAHFYPILVC